MSAVADKVTDEHKLGFGLLTSPTPRSLIGGLAAATAWLVAALITALWPDRPGSDWGYTDDFAALCGVLAIALALAAIAGVRFTGIGRVRRAAPWLVAFALFLTVWEAVTAKLGLLPLPFFPPPQAILEVVIDDRAFAWRRHPRLFPPAGDRLPSRCRNRVPDRRSDWLVADRRVLDSSDLTVYWSLAGDSLVAASLLRIPLKF